MDQALHELILFGEFTNNLKIFFIPDICKEKINERQCDTEICLSYSFINIFPEKNWLMSRLVHIPLKQLKIYVN